MSCILCKHRKVHEINADLLAGVGLGTASKKYKIPRATLGKHRSQCLGLRQGDGTLPVDRSETSTKTSVDVHEPKNDKPKKQAITLATRHVPNLRTKNPGDDPVTSPRTLAMAELEERAVDLRVRGWAYKAIATEVGVDEHTVIDAVERVLQRTRKGTNNQADHLRGIERERLDQLLKGAWERASSKPSGELSYKAQDSAIQTVLRIMERRAKLEGLDIPTGPSTVNIIAHPMVAPVISQFMSMVRRVLDMVLPTVTDTRGQTKVISTLAEAAVVLGDEGERALETWFSTAEGKLRAIDTTAEVSEPP